MMTRPIFDPDWRIADDLQLFLKDWIIENDPDVIVEFGSGASTVEMAMAKRHDAELISFEQSLIYRNTTLAALEREPYVNNTTVYHAHIFDGWYDRFVVAPALTERIIDLVVVDGPGPCVGRTREPAMKWVYPRLAEGGLIVLDDGRRDTEKLYVKHWQEQFPGLAVEYVAHDHGTYLIRKETDG